MASWVTGEYCDSLCVLLILEQLSCIIKLKDIKPLAIKNTFNYIIDQQLMFLAMHAVLHSKNFAQTNT